MSLWVAGIGGAAALGAAGIGAAGSAGLFGGGGRGGYQAIDLGALEKIAKENSRSVQYNAYGVIQRDIKRLENGKYAVVNKAGRTIRTFDTKAEATNFVDTERKEGKPNPAPPLIPTITRLSDRFVKSVDQQVAAGNKQLTAAQKTLLNRIKGHDARLNRAQNREDRELKRDLDKITADLEAGMDLLNEQDRQEFASALGDFNQQAQQLTDAFDERSTDVVETSDAEREGLINDFKAENISLADIFDAASRAETDKFSATTGELSERLRTETEKQDAKFREESFAETAAQDSRGVGIIDRFDDETKGLNNLYRSETTANINRAESDSKTLGDTYLSMTDASKSDYDTRLKEALDLSPERLSEFTQAADFISKAAFQTRADMLSAADPRALELSAIADNNAAAMMSGQISADMQANLARSSAMRALGGGFGAGSEMGRGLAARDLGLTSLDLMRQGTDMYDTQRRLNYDTRVAGVAEGAGANAGQFLANDQRLRREGAADLLSADNVRNTTFFQEGRQSIFDILGQRNTSAFNAADQGRLSLTERQRAELGQLNEVSTNRLNILNTSNRDARATLTDLYTGGRADARVFLDSNLGAIESGRDFRGNALTEGLRSNQTRITDRSRDLLGIAGSVLQSGLDTNRLGFDARQNNIGDRTARESNKLTNIFDRNFVSRQGVYNENLNTARSIYNTNTNTAGNLFTARENAISRNTALRIDARSVATGNKIAGATGVFDAMNAARAQGSATMSQAMMQNWSGQNAWNAAAASNNQAMWGNAINAGASVFGSLAGNVFQPRTSTGYSGFTTNPATNTPIGYATPQSYRLPGTSNWVNT